MAFGEHMDAWCWSRGMYTHLEHNFRIWSRLLVFLWALFDPEIVSVLVVLLIQEHSRTFPIHSSPQCVFWLAVLLERWSGHEIHQLRSNQLFSVCRIGSYLSVLINCQITKNFFILHFTNRSNSYQIIKDQFSRNSVQINPICNIHSDLSQVGFFSNPNYS